VKTPKSASSTAAAVALRIQGRHSCCVQWQHGRAADIYANAILSSSSSSYFLIAPVRTPDARALSSVYYHKVSFHGRAKKKKTPSDNFIIKQLGQTTPNYITDYIALKQINNNMVDTVRDVIANYDFLILAERMDESLVVFSWLTGIPLTSLLTMSSKIAGSSWYRTNNKCIQLAKPVVTTAIAEYFASDSWKATHSADRLLYAAANRSLDRTIQAIENFEGQLATFRRLQAEIQEKCRNETHLPCSSNGTVQLELARQNCYARDFGCGYPCIDRIVMGWKENWKQEGCIIFYQQGVMEQLYIPGCYRSGMSNRRGNANKFQQTHSISVVSLRDASRRCLHQALIEYGVAIGLVSHGNKLKRMLRKNATLLCPTDRMALTTIESIRKKTMRIAKNDGLLTLVALLQSQECKLTLWSTAPGIHFTLRKCSRWNRTIVDKCFCRQGLCLVTQYFPDSITVDADADQHPEFAAGKVPDSHQGIPECQTRQY